MRRGERVKEMAQDYVEIFTFHIYSVSQWLANYSYKVGKYQLLKY
jgi:hypothetical protein